MKVLLVEDDEILAEKLGEGLKQQRYVVEHAADGQLGLELARTSEPDLMIVDVDLPKLNGITLCQRVRAAGQKTPILLLTGRDSDHDKVLGLDAGADDYLVKPCSLAELLARLRALSRRRAALQASLLQWGELQLDPALCEVTYRGKPVVLRPKEYSILELFLRDCHRVFSRAAIVDHLWVMEDPPNEDTIKSHIKGLRKSLQAAGAPADLIESVYGLGYRLNQTPLAAADPPLPDPLTTPTEQALQSLKDAWPRFKPKVLERLTIIDQAIQAYEQGALSDDLRLPAQQAAHKLAGSLGTMGFPPGTQLARQLEQGLKLPPANSATLRQQMTALQATLNQDPQFTRPQRLLATPPCHGVTGSRLLLVGSDATTQRILQEVSHWGIQLAQVNTVDRVRQHIQALHPDVLLLDLAELGETAYPLLAELQQRPHPLPTLVISAEQTLSERISLARLGVKGVLSSPIELAQVVEVVQRIRRQQDPGGIRLLVVDDDPEFLTVLQTLLDPWGFILTLVTDPQQTWDRLQSCQPDLVILNVNMPLYSGIEICQAIRSDPQFGNLPVLFLTADRDADTIQQLFSAGGDDYVNKPVVGPELIARILNRLARLGP
jgi:DNA-binding response OmpR family regulator